MGTRALLDSVIVMGLMLYHDGLPSCNLLGACLFLACVVLKQARIDAFCYRGL